MKYYPYPATIAHSIPPIMVCKYYPAVQGFEFGLAGVVKEQASIVLYVNRDESLKAKQAQCSH